MTKKLRPKAWTLFALALAGAISLPVLVVLSQLGAEDDGVWGHLVDTVLDDYVENTAWLLLGVGVGTFILGVGCAWIVTMVRFPGRRLCTWGLLLPMAMPTYLMAYTYTDLLQFSGPIQTALRDTFDWSKRDYWFPEIRSLGGAIVAFSFVLYPYVYLLARAAFLEQSATVLEASRTLGCGPWRSFRKIALPLARPAIVAGLSLALMETLAEFGAVDYFAVDTLATGIYRTWTAWGSPQGASQLAAVMVSFVFVVLILERACRGRAKFHHSTHGRGELSAYPMGRRRQWFALAICLVPITFGFLLPVGVLAKMALETDHTIGWEGVPALIRNTLTLAVITTALVVAVGWIIAYGQRLDRNVLMRLGARVVSLGYAMPGSVVAVGVLIAVGHFAEMSGVFLGGTIVVLIFAYSVRFAAVSVQSLEAGLEKIHPSMDQAARTLGSRPFGVLTRIHAPLMRVSLFTACLQVFVDVMKELPATMMIRPFDFDTLAVRVHHYASDERLAQSAVPALLIVAVGLAPVLLLSRVIDRARAFRNAPR